LISLISRKVIPEVSLRYLNNSDYYFDATGKYMDIIRAKEIVEMLVNGVNPITGETQGKFMLPLDRCGTVIIARNF
jgi:rRNA processing protein Krr1/Pno1